MLQSAEFFRILSTHEAPHIGLRLEDNCVSPRIFYSNYLKQLKLQVKPVFDPECSLPQIPASSTKCDIYVPYPCSYRLLCLYRDVYAPVLSGDIMQL